MVSKIGFNRGKYAMVQVSYDLARKELFPSPEPDLPTHYLLPKSHKSRADGDLDGLASIGTSGTKRPRSPSLPSPMRATSPIDSSDALEPGVGATGKRRRLETSSEQAGADEATRRVVVVEQLMSSLQSRAVAHMQDTSQLSGSSFLYMLARTEIEPHLDNPFLALARESGMDPLELKIFTRCNTLNNYFEVATRQMKERKIDWLADAGFEAHIDDLQKGSNGNDFLAKTQRLVISALIHRRLQATNTEKSEKNVMQMLSADIPNLPMDASRRMSKIYSKDFLE